MGIYSHFTTEQLPAKRNTYWSALQARLVLRPSKAYGEDRSVRLAQAAADIEHPARAVNKGLAGRSGGPIGGPICLALA